ISERSLDTESCGGFMYKSDTAGHRRLSKNLYAKLAVSPNASPETIQTAYLALKKAYNPDGGYSDDLLYEAFSQISNAAAILGNPKTRKFYDRGYIDEAGALTQAGLADKSRSRRNAAF